ncbi:hypothetical protein BGZ76_002688 [Entomortierella beljakovae]|nr:hypothetical protein BGZ76_002688 [Entomortierella beljakovae]
MAKDIQLALHAYLSQASQATSLQNLNEHLEAFSREWKKEPSLEQFDTALGLLLDSKKSPNYEPCALWWMGYVQDICQSTQIDRYSTDLSNALVKSADPLAELVKSPSATVTKRALQVCSAIYSTVFQICCQESASNVGLWNEYAIRIKGLALSHFRGVGEGVTLSLCKYIQSVIQVQSYSQPNSTPQESEVEAFDFIEGSSTVVTAVINQTSALQRARPQFIPQILGVWMSFVKPSLPAHFTSLQSRFIDKSIRIQLLSLSKIQLQPQQTQALTEALSLYGIKFNGTALGRSQQQQLLHPDKDNGDDPRRHSKRSRATNQDSEDADMKRLKSEPDLAGFSIAATTSATAATASAATAAITATAATTSSITTTTTAAGMTPVATPAIPSIPPGFGQTLLGQINITQLPLHHVVDIIFETLAANGIPHLFHSFLATLPVMRLKEGPLPIPPPGVGPPPPGLMLQFPPPPLLPGMIPPHSGGIPPPLPHMPPPHSGAGTSAPPLTSAPLAGVKQEVKQEVKKEINLSKLQLPKIRDDVQVAITALPPKHTPAQLPSRPIVVRSDSVTIAPRIDTSAETDANAAPAEMEDIQRKLKEETFQVKPFEPLSERPAPSPALTPCRILLEQTFQRILDSEHIVSVPGVSGRKMLEFAASSYKQLEEHSEGHEGEVVPFQSGASASHPAKVVTKADWMTIVARLLTRAFTRDYEASSSSINQDMKEKMIKYICSDFKQRRELALTWLHEEWYFDGICERQEDNMDSREPQYLWCLYKILDGITSGATQLDPKDRGLTRFLLEVPELPDGAVDVIQRYCDDPLRAQLGIACLRDVVNLRPPSRARALEILLGYTSHTEKLQRSMAIVTAKKWYLEHPTVGAKVEEYALEQLELLKDFTMPRSDHSEQQSLHRGNNIKAEGAELAVSPTSGKSLDPKVKSEPNEGSLSNQSGGETASGVPGATRAQPSEEVVTQAEENIGRLLELYFSLCAKNHGFLEVLFRNYIAYDPFVQRVIRQKIQPLIKSIKSDSPKLLALIRDFPKGAEMLVLRIIFILTDGVLPSPGLVSAVQDAVITHDLNARFLIPIISGLDREAVILCLPRIVGLLKGTERERRTVTDVFIKLLTGNRGIPGQTLNQPVPNVFERRSSTLGAASQPQIGVTSAQSRGPVLSPSELLIELHVLEDTVGWKAACEAMDICFGHPEIYKSEIIAVVLQQLLDLPNIPSLFMRTVIQAITLYENLVGFVNSMILKKLVGRKVWTKPVLWKGFVRCSKLTQPGSCSILATLPKPQLKDVLTMEPSLKEPVDAYLKAKSSGRRIGGGAAKQVNVLHVANVNSSAAIPSSEEVVNRGQEGSEANSAVDDVMMEPNKDQGAPLDINA